MLPELTISINFIDHILQFGLCRILSQWPHDCTQLLGCNCAIAVFVKQWECLFEFYITTNAASTHQLINNNNNNVTRIFKVP